VRVLVTGAAGSIGTVVCSGLVDRGRDLVGLDLAPEPEGFTGEWFTVDCTDPDAVDAVVGRLAHAGGLDAVVHLAGNPGETSLPDAVESHLVTTAALLEAMVAHDVRRMVFASSNHSVGFTPRVDVLTAETRPRPDTFYGVAKVAAEALLSLYADRYGIDAIATRIGTFAALPETERALSTWLSHDDAVRMFDACLEAPGPGFAVLYGVSANTRGWWDLDPGRGLGYHPKDDAERHAAQVVGSPSGVSGERAQSDESDGAHVGGSFATDRYRRPAFDAPPASST
jgi:uronate dehydrogenase